MQTIARRSISNLLLSASVVFCSHQSALAQESPYWNFLDYLPSWNSSKPATSVTKATQEKPSVTICVYMKDESQKTFQDQRAFLNDRHKLVSEKSGACPQLFSQTHPSRESQIYVEKLEEAMQVLPYFSKAYNTTLLIKDESQSEEAANRWIPFISALQNITTLAFPQDYRGFITDGTWKNLAANSQLIAMENMLVTNSVTLERNEGAPNKLLQANKGTMKRIDLSWTIADVSLLFSGVTAFPQLKELDLSCTLLNDKGLESVGQLIENAPFLESLKLRYFTPFDLPPFTLEGLSSFVEKHLKTLKSPLKTLGISTYLVASDCSDYMITTGIPMIIGLPYLENLSIGLAPSKELDSSTLFTLGEIIAASKTNHLHVQFFGTDLQLQKFFEGMGKTQSQILESLHYEGDSQKSFLEGPKALAQLLVDNKSITKLKLELPMAEEAEKAMADALQTNLTLEHYIIDGFYYALSMEGAKAFSKALENRKIPLKSINLGTASTVCAISNCFAPVIARGTIVKSNVIWYAKEYFDNQ